MASIPNIEVTVTGYDPISLDISMPQGADGIVLQLDRPTLSIPSLSDGSSPVLTQAVITATVLRGPNNDTVNWILGATPSGCTGSFASPTYTVSGMASDTATVTFTATRTGFATLTAVCTLAKVKQPDIATVVHAADAATADDADEFGFWDAAVTALRKITWANIKSTLATAFKHGGSNEISTATAAANAIPKSGAGGTLAAGWLPQATESAVGGAELATSVEIVAGTDTGADRTLTPGRLKTALASDGMWLTKRTKMPDGATAVYTKNFSSLVDVPAEWAGVDSTLAITSGELVATFIGSAGRFNLTYAIGLAKDVKKICLRMKKTGNVSGFYIYLNGPNVQFRVVSLGTAIDMYVIDISTVADVAITGVRFYFFGGTLAGSTLNISGISIGDYSYLTGSLSEEAARIADQLGDTAGVGVAASGTITTTITNVSDGDTVTIAGKEYKYKTTLSAGPTVEGEVLIGADRSESFLNLRNAINDPTSYPTKCTCAAAHPLVTASYTTGLVLTVTAKSTGLLGNQITLAKSAVTLTLSGSTLSGGIDDVGAKLSYQVARSSQQLTAKTSIAQTDYLCTLDSADGFIKKKVLASNALASESAYGLAKLAADGGTTAGTVVQANDSRLGSAANLSWTPVPQFGGVNDDGTFTVSNNRYNQIAAKVYSGECTISWTAKGTKTGNFTITGLPVAQAAGSSGFLRGFFRPANMVGMTAGGAVFTEVQTATIFAVVQTTTGIANLTDANFANNTIIRFTWTLTIA